MPSVVRLVYLLPLMFSGVRLQFNPFGQNFQQNNNNPFGQFRPEFQNVLRNNFANGGNTGFNNNGFQQQNQGFTQQNGFQNGFQTNPFQQNFQQSIPNQLLADLNSLPNNLTPVVQSWINTLLPIRPGQFFRLRREYRLLSDTERNNFHRAIQLLRADTTVPPNKYDALAMLHFGITSINAHTGPNFVGWHRWFLYLFENALREKVPSITVPYWDNTLDNFMTDPSRSITFSPQFMGNGNGNVTTGPFAGFNTCGGPLQRTVGMEGRLMNLVDIQTLYQNRNLGQISNPGAANDSNFETIHNAVHRFIGGQMAMLETASCDPIFWIHHAFVDCVWEDFRRWQRAFGVDPATDYPQNFGFPEHSPNFPMGFGNLRVIHGITDAFTNYVYRCDRTPTCSMWSPFCGSRYLRCDTNLFRCVPIENPNLPPGKK